MIVLHNIFTVFTVRYISHANVYGYETQWIKQICTGADDLRWRPGKDAYIPTKKKMVGYSTRFISSSCGDEMFSTGFKSISTDIPPVDIAPTFVEKYLK